MKKQLPSPKTNKNRIPFDMESSKKNVIIDLIQKSHHAGRIYRLPRLSQLQNPMTKLQLKAWSAAFLALFTEEEQGIIKNSMFLWRADDDMYGEAVRNGIPGNANDTKWLFNNARLLKQDFQPVLSDNEIGIINAAEKLVFPEEFDSSTAATKCSDCKKDHHGSCNYKIEVYNKVANKITGNKLSAFKLFEGGDDYPNKTKQILIYTRKVLEKFKSNASNYINLDMVPQFEDGHYQSWEALMKAIYRMYKVEENQENMAQLFHSIDDVVSSKSKSTETKIGNLREILRRILIKGSENYFISKDYETGREMQLADEAYTPVINTLLTYIIMKEGIDKKKWDELQLAFERKIEAGWSYKKWHQKRPELYKLMDDMQKVAKSDTGGAVYSIGLEEGNNEASEPTTVEEDQLEELQLQINQLRKGRFQNRQRNWTTPNNRRNVSSQPQNDWRQKPNESQTQNTKNKLCLNCSHHAGKLVYHSKNVYGASDECDYDEKGVKRSSFKNRVATLDHDEGSVSNNADLKRYYEERLALISNIQNEE